MSRFGDRVTDYARYRPGYPAELGEWLWKQASLDQNAVVADIGSGTGLFTRLIIPLARAVYAVEPNAPMRQAAENDLGPHANFHSHQGSCTETGLPAASIDLITVAQAFHWFDIPATLAEFRRIARPDAHLALVWNKRPTDTPFLTAYEAALRRHCPEYGLANYRDMAETVLMGCFGGPMITQDFANPQSHDLDAVLGGMQSASYCPKAGQLGHQSLVEEVSEAFGRWAVDGWVDFPLVARVYFGLV